MTVVVHSVVILDDLCDFGAQASKIHMAHAR
jgi:hypothetical protein